MKSCIGGAVVLGAMALTPGPQPAAAEVCGNWTYTDDGGFEGGEPMAALYCGPVERLALICHGAALSLRYIPVGAPVDAGADHLPIGYTAGAVTVRDYARYEGALGDWVIYRVADDTEHPLFAALRRETTVTVTLADRGGDEVSLAGSAGPIGRVLEACAAS